MILVEVSELVVHVNGRLHRFGDLRGRAQSHHMGSGILSHGFTVLR